MMGFKFPDPPNYYKKFKEGFEAIEPPDLDKVKSKTKTYCMFGKSIPVPNTIFSNNKST